VHAVHNYLEASVTATEVKNCESCAKIRQTVRFRVDVAFSKECRVCFGNEVFTFQTMPRQACGQ
jgi:hypothetical protein